MSCYGLNSRIERRKSFTFAYFNRPISRTESIWYTSAHNHCHNSSVVSGDYADIEEIYGTPQDDQVFLTPPETLHSSLDDLQMECDVHPDTDDSFEEDYRHPPALTALKCDSIAPPELELVFVPLFCLVIFASVNVSAPCCIVVYVLTFS